MYHHETHKVHRIGWLRAAVLGANDGIVSTASLVIGVAAANATPQDIFLAGIAGMIAGTMSMAAGEYVSVSSQADTEKADLVQEKEALENHYDAELLELAAIYEQRGLTSDLAREVASQLMNHNALEAHARDEIGISSVVSAQPIQAAISSALSFLVGAILPLLVIWLAPIDYIIPAVAVFSLFFLIILGCVSAYAGGASMFKAAARVSFWGMLAMIITAITGKLFGVMV